MEAKSQFLPEHQLIIAVFSGTIDLESVIASRKADIDAGWFQTGANSLIVLNSDSIVFTMEDVKKYVEWANENFKPLPSSKTAILVDAPLETAFSSLMRNRMSSFRTLEVFCTLQAAADWLSVPASAILAAAPEAQPFDA